MKRFVVVILLLSAIIIPCLAHSRDGHIRDWNMAFGIEDSNSKKVVEPLWYSAQNVIDHYQDDYDSLKNVFPWFNIGIKHRLLFHWGFNGNPETFEPLAKVVDECLDSYFKDNNLSGIDNPFSVLLNKVKETLELLFKPIKDCLVFCNIFIFDKLIKNTDLAELRKYLAPLGEMIRNWAEIINEGTEILKYLRPIQKAIKYLFKFAKLNPLLYLYVTLIEKIIEPLFKMVKELSAPYWKKAKEKVKNWVRRVKNNLDSKKLKEKTKFYIQLKKIQARNNRLLIAQVKRVFNIDGARQYPNAIATLIHDIHLLGDHTTTDQENLLDLDSIRRDIDKNGIGKLFKGEKTKRLADIESRYNNEIRMYRLTKYIISNEVKANKLLQIICRYLPLVLNERLKNTLKGAGIKINELP